LFALGLVAVGGLGWGGCGKPGAITTGANAPEVQVVAVEARRQPVAETLSQVGTVMANEMVEIKAETDGVIQEILFTEGQAVERGQLLVQLDESKLAAAVSEAEANFKLSAANHERAKQLLRDQLISQQEYDQAASAYDFNRASLALKRRQLADARIHAPFKGIVGARNVSPGQVISKNTTLTWLVDLDPVKVEMNVPERFLSQLKVGQEIEFPIAAYAGQRFRGEVYFISPFVDEATRSALVKARLANPRHELKPGMFATLDLTLRVREEAVVIPEAALGQILEGDQADIYLVDDAQTVQRRRVSLGVRLPGDVEVLAGLQGGEKVVVEGLQKVAPGARVVLAPQEAAAPYVRVAPGTNAPVREERMVPEPKS
jgi:membrane fusion protein (multidrug efflux system)